jgi:hypothetical protein
MASDVAPRKQLKDAARFRVHGARHGDARAN